MADIARYPLVRHLRGSATTHVEQIRNGKTIRAGVGAYSWMRSSPVLAMATIISGSINFFRINCCAVSSTPHSTPANAVAASKTFCPSCR